MHEREHEASERAHRREHDANDKAIDLALRALEHRLEELNKLRGEVITDRSQFVLVGKHDADLTAIKVEFRGKHDALGQRVDNVEKLIDRFEGSVSTWRAIAAFLGVSGVGAIIWAIVQSGRP